MSKQNMTNIQGFGSQLKFSRVFETIDIKNVETNNKKR